MTVRLLHLTDPHLSSLADVSPWSLHGKRRLGYLSWWRKRRHQLSAATLARVTAAACDDAPDLALVTGDLVHIGLPPELVEARRWLDGLAARVPVVLAPGNHDCYRADTAAGIAQAWQPFLPEGAAGSPGFPRLVTRDEVAIIALSSAVPRPWWSAGGRLGDAQRAALERLLTSCASRFRCVLLHHAPLPGQAPGRKALDDARELAALLERHGVELVLHGHLHHNDERRLGSRTQVFVSAPASSCSRSNPAAYRLFDISRDGGEWLVQATLKTEDAGSMRTVEERRWRLPVLTA
ncbi:MAG: metallophosphoesterase [Gammaproteobacteria bacterium]